MPANVPKFARSAAVGASFYTWANPWGGAWNSAADWIDTNTGLIVASPPDVTSAVSIVGGTSLFTNVINAGAAASLGIANDVILWGTYTVAGAVNLTMPSGSGYTTPDLELDGGAILTGASLSIVDGTLESGSGSMVRVSGAAILNQAFLLAINGGGIQLGALIANNIYNGGSNYVTPLIAVDDASFIQAGTSAGATLGAFTVDVGHTATISGAIDANVVLNGMLAVQGGNSLAINGANPFGTAKLVAGGGTLVINEGSTMTLSIASSSAIQFAAPNGTLSATALPSGTISGFAPGDVIEFLSSAGVSASSLATGLSYQQITSNSGRLTLNKAGQSVGTLAFAGNYTGSPFHLSLDALGNDFITVQTIGGPPVQPSLITGTVGSDTLYATANQQTLTGLGGTDILQARSFTGITFRDTSANLNGSTITSFGLSDIIDLTDMTPATASATYSLAAAGSTINGNTSAVLTVTDGTHTAVVNIGFSGASPTGTFTSVSDGIAGTDVQYVAGNNDALTFGPAQGGSYGVAANWQDGTTHTTAAKAPGPGNAVTLAGGSAYSGITGNGVASSLTTSGDVLLWGSLNVGGVIPGVSGTLTQTGTLALDGGGAIVLTGQANVGGVVEIGPGSRLTAAGGLSFTANGASLLAVGGGAASFAQVLGAIPGSSQVDSSVVAVDTTSAIEFGLAGNAARGALTIDNGVTANLLGTIEGNVVVNGTLAVVQSGALAIGPFGPATSSITGSGTLAIASAGTLTLSGSDSAAILFGPIATSVTLPEMLALNGALPTGMITGFSTGDAITMARSITGVVYTQTGTAGGTLTLLNGSATVGTLSFAGSYMASQFLVTPSADARSSTITYLATPNTMTGNQVSDNSHAYNWTNGSGGAWSNPANWIDTTAGAIPLVAPGVGSAVVFGPVTGGLSGARIVSGSGSAASVLVGQYAVFTGTLAVSGLFSVQGYQSEAMLENGASLSVGSVSDSSALAITGNSTLLVSGASSANTIIGALTITGGSVARLLGGTANALGGTIAIDGTSSFEIGASGSAGAGALTIDNGMTATVNNGVIKANLTVNGSLIVAGGTTTVDGFGGTSGSLGGTGTITLQSTTLVLNASGALAIAFRGGSLSTLELKGALPTGVISGFVSGDTIRLDQSVTGFSFRQTTSTQGTLTLTNGAANVGTLTFNGNYATSLFQVDVAAATGVATLSLQSAVSAGTLSAVSTGRDAYTWVGRSGGTWTTAANWTDTTTTSTPTTSPGSFNAVSLTGATAAGQYSTIGGNGSAASLAVGGNVLLKGQVTVVGKLSVATATGGSAMLALSGGARMTTATAAVTGRLEVESTSVATISGLATLTGGSLLALGGSTVQLGGLIGNGSGNVLAIDTNSLLRIGNATVAAAGALTQAAGSTAAMTGAIYGSVSANGTFSVAGGGSLFIDLSGTAESDPYATVPTIGGTGTFSLTENSTLGFGVADTVAIRFAGPNATLVLVTPAAGTISGFMAGDQIQIDQGVTGLSYRQVSASTGTLTLTRGTVTIGVLQLAGSYGVGNAFHLDAAANGNTAVITLQSIGIAATQPTLIQGTSAADLLTATASGQTINGLGGGDTLSGAGFTGIDFMDLTANMNACAIQGFSTSDWLDFTDMTAASATLTYAGGRLGVTDGNHSASLGIGFASMPATGAFHAAADGTGGTKVSWS